MQSPRPRRRWQLTGGCNVAGRRHKHQGGEGVQSGKLRWRDSHQDGRSTMRGSVRVGMMVLGSGEGSVMVVSIQRGLLQYGRTKGSEEGSTLVDDDDWRERLTVWGKEAVVAVIISDSFRRRHG
jgi:hypothetical protein